MTTIVYFFWDGFGAAGSAVTLVHRWEEVAEIEADPFGVVEVETIA